MLIDTRAIDFPMTGAILRHVEHRVESALGPLARAVLKVTARLEDVNAGRGGIDKRCGLTVALRRHGVVVARATDFDLYVAVDRAARRARRLVLRALRQHVRRQRGDRQRPGALVGA
jgi:ribosome-associated translation inhibitor RaiA